MSKKTAKVLPATPPTQPEAKSPAELLEEILKEARALPPGSDVEGFMEERLIALTRSTRGAVAQCRAADQDASAHEADFPPSAVPQMQRGDETGADEAATNRDDVGPSDL